MRTSLGSQSQTFISLSTCANVISTHLLFILRPQLWTLVSNQDEQTNGYSELWLEGVKSSTKFGDLFIKMFNFVYQKY